MSQTSTLKSKLHFKVFRESEMYFASRTLTLCFLSSKFLANDSSKWAN